MSESPSLMKRIKAMPPVRLIVVSFFLIILVGTLLLMTPAAARDGRATSFVDALFTATSATCVTGLVPFDTWTHWSLFGQIIILGLIQTGGLGVVTFTTGFTILVRRKLGLRDLQLATENTAGNTIDVIRLVRMILVFTFSSELIGAGLLSIRFIGDYGPLRGIWISVFEAVSAYCNAGFDILGFRWKDGSMTGYADDPLVCLTIAGLIILGGLGFIVINDIYIKKIQPRLKKETRGHLNLHSSIVLKMTLFLLVLGTVLFFVLEYDNTLQGHSFFEKLNISFFQSASARTAGFAAVDMGQTHDVTKLSTIFLMFIGAAPASTGGGLKVTTFIILISTVVSVIRGYDDTILSKRRIDKAIVYRALTILGLAFLVVFVTSGVIMATNGQHPVSAIDALFESVSAFATVGLTANVTQFLSPVSKIALSFAMFIGRVGPVSLGLALSTHKNHKSGAVLPEGKVIVG